MDTNKFFPSSHSPEKQLFYDEQYSWNPQKKCQRKHNALKWMEETQVKRKRLQSRVGKVFLEERFDDAVSHQ